MKKMASKIIIFCVSIVVLFMFEGCSSTQQLTLTPQQQQKQDRKDEINTYFEIYGQSCKDGYYKWINDGLSLNKKKYLVSVIGDGELPMSGLKKYKRMSREAKTSAENMLARVLGVVVKIHEYENSNDTIIQNKQAYHDALQINIKKNVDSYVYGAIPIRQCFTKDGLLHVQVVLEPTLMKRFLRENNISSDEFKSSIEKIKEFDKISKKYINEVKKDFGN